MRLSGLLWASLGLSGLQQCRSLLTARFTKVHKVMDGMEFVLLNSTRVPDSAGGLKSTEAGLEHVNHKHLCNGSTWGIHFVVYPVFYSLKSMCEGNLACFFLSAKAWRLGPLMPPSTWWHRRRDCSQRSSVASSCYSLYSCSASSCLDCSLHDHV